MLFAGSIGVKAFKVAAGAWKTGRTAPGHDIGDVGGDGRGGRRRTRAGALQIDPADPRAFDEERVQRAAGLGQGMICATRVGWTRTSTPPSERSAEAISLIL